jgi:hypothetical protein
MTVDQHNPIYLPVQDWPAQDQSAWDAMFADGDVFDSAGAARHWAKATRHKPSALRPVARLAEGRWSARRQSRALGAR